MLLKEKLYRTINIMQYVYEFLGAYVCDWGFPGGSVVKNPPVKLGSAGHAVSIPGFRRPLEEGMASHSRILAWEISWIEEPGGLQSMG